MVKKAFVGFWNILNFSRRLVLNILFFFILIALFVSIMSSEDEIIVEQDSALVLSLSGNIVEYRKELVNRIGEARVIELENDNEPRKFDREYLERVKKIFRKRTRIYKKIRKITM